jgi:Cu2+-exporting ATPase
LKLQRVVFDKTGTLTLDRPALENKQALSELNDHQKEVLFSLTKKSLHPLSRSLFSELIQQGVTHSSLKCEVVETPGKGVFTTVNGSTFSIERPDESNQSLSCDFRCDGEILARFDFAESPRENTREAITQVQAMMPQPPMILSGDVEPSVRKMAEHLGIKDYAAALKPEQKLERIHELQSKGDLLYIGDGMNDIPAMREARLSAAPFANVNLVTKDVDFLFTDETLGFLPNLLRLSKLRNFLSRQLLLFTTLYNVSVVIVAALGYMSPFVAAIIMPLSSLVSLFIVTRKKV